MIYAKRTNIDYFNLGRICPNESSYLQTKKTLVWIWIVGQLCEFAAQFLKNPCNQERRDGANLLSVIIGQYLNKSESVEIIS